jgi:NAD(P)-dependent dehydrogenase (short-subunit alcohol dehydrogenase family)
MRSITNCDLFNINVVIIEPGNFETEILNNIHLTNEWTERKADPEYVNLARVERRNRLPQEAGDAKVVARAIADVTHEERPKRRYLVGDDAARRAQQTTQEREDEIWLSLGL